MCWGGWKCYADKGGEKFCCQQVGLRRRDNLSSSCLSHVNLRFLFPPAVITLFFSSFIHLSGFSIPTSPASCWNLRFLPQIQFFFFFAVTYVQNSSATLALVLLFQNPLGNHYRTRRFIPNNLHSMSSGEKGGFFKQTLKCSSRVLSLRGVVIREWD